eukprot:1348511-Amphidinium_carterae.1
MCCVHKKQVETDAVRQICGAIAESFFQERLGWLLTGKSTNAVACAQMRGTYTCVFLGSCNEGVVIRPKSERSRQMLPLGNQVSNRPDSDQLADTLAAADDLLTHVKEGVRCNSSSEHAAKALDC